MGIRSIIGKSLIGLSLVTLLFTGYTYYRDQLVINDVQDTMKEEELKVEDIKDPIVPTNTKAILEKFEKLYSENNDLVGWIRIENTAVDYPVLQFIDNAYYLDRDFYGQKSKAGSIFMDYRNEAGAASFNTILYGHHMADGSMFKDLMKYKRADFLENHKIIRFDVLNQEYEWEIFSVYVTDVEFYYIDTNFPTVDKKLTFIQAIQEKSLHQSGIQVGPEDHILTLSTCSYEFDNARFVVHARRIDRLDTASPTLNE